MIRRYSFLPVIFCLLMAVSWLSRQVKPIAQRMPASSLPPETIEGIFHFSESPDSKDLFGHVFKQLQILRDHPKSEKFEEPSGPLRGYFRYQVTETKEGRRIASAQGIRAPVLGVVLQLGAPESESFSGLVVEPISAGGSGE